MEQVLLNWCEDKCETLSLINELVDMRGVENIPVRVFALRGSKEDIDLVIEKEKALFPNSIISNQVGNKKSCLYFIPETNPLLKEKLKDYILLDVSSLYKEDLVEKMITDLRFSNSKDLIAVFDKESLNSLLEKDYNNILMRILLNYTKRTKQDGTSKLNLLEMSDISFLESLIKPAETAKEAPVITTDDKVSPPEEEAALEKEKPSKANTEEVLSSPKPQEVQKVKTTFKDHLTEDENKNNRRLLDNLRIKYQTVISVIEDTKDSRFNALKKEIEEALNTDVYKKQWCPLYLDITDDISTPLYARLYQLDQETLSFNKNVIRQGVHLACGLCGHEWDEDVTFKEKGVIYAECPECFAQRPFDKE